MAIILGENQVYTDKFGYTHSNFYAVADYIAIDKNQKLVNFQVCIYKDMEARLQKAQPIEMLNYNIDKEVDFNAFINSITVEGGLYKAVYRLVMTDPRWVNWVSDEE